MKKVLFIACIAYIALAAAQTHIGGGGSGGGGGGTVTTTGTPTTNSIVKFSGLTSITNATFTDFVNSFTTGTPSSTTFLSGTGVWTTISSAFSAVTSGTNTATLLMGTGGSLGVTGSGTINATSLGGTIASFFVQGASNLTNTGAIPFQNGTTGVMTQATGLHYDAGGGTAYVGTAFGFDDGAGHLQRVMQSFAGNTYIDFFQTNGGIFRYNNAGSTWLTVSGSNGAATFGGTSVGAPLYAPTTLYSAAGTPLPACVSGLKGYTTVVSDATSPTFLANYTSGGAVNSPVMCNGSNWVTY